MRDLPPITGRERLAELLQALADTLSRTGSAFELVVAGGAALQALGLVVRATRDVDVLALRERGRLLEVQELPEALRIARDEVARDFGLPADWLNLGPASLLRFGLPSGFKDRLQPRVFGRALTVHLTSRFDQIHFKLFAFADLGPGRHEADLRMLAPNEEELLVAASWVRTQDPSQAFRSMLVSALERLGVEDADGRI